MCTDDTFLAVELFKGVDSATPARVEMFNQLCHLKYMFMSFGRIDGCDQNHCL